MQYFRSYIFVGKVTREFCCLVLIFVPSYIVATQKFRTSIVLGVKRLENLRENTRKNIPKTVEKNTAFSFLE